MLNTYAGSWQQLWIHVRSIIVAAKCQNLTNFDSACIFTKGMTIFVSTKSLFKHG
jgi:hypothetical protein